MGAQFYDPESGSVFDDIMREYAGINGNHSQNKQFNEQTNKTKEKTNMARYGSEDYGDPGASIGRQQDLVLSTNEFCFVQSKTNGSIKTHTGPLTITISQQENLVVFNSRTKRFEETRNFEDARQLFVSAPEGWYIVLKNPTKDNVHPEVAKAVVSPDLLIGHKINIPGPTSFSLFPGQMARVIRGHRLRSNQYLLARVYDAAAAKNGASTATMIDAEGNAVDVKHDEYFVGQLLVIKGTEVSFYIPPTGIEVIPTDTNSSNPTYVRDAVTLERLEYAILKDEDGEKRYIHGPAVVFPKPTETFVNTPKGGVIFRALELSPISGIYVKVIAAYDDEDKSGKKVHHPIGEELFITGNDQMIYYPRPEHAMIQYDNRYMHHAIAIPEGEGRYVLNRLTGKITTIKGPKMYLPDPRTEVVVKRKLTTKECEIIYPGNREVLEYNTNLTEKAMNRAIRKGLNSQEIDEMLDNTYATDTISSLAIFEANANISRGTSYTKPRTITLDTKYDGVVAVDVWTGYAVNVVSKNGKREVVCGPTTRLLDYEETLEALELSTGKPKTTDNLCRTGFLLVENNKISDIVYGQTADFVDVSVGVSYCVNFLKEYQDKWFSVGNYVKYLCDHMKSLLKRELKKHTIQDFYANSTDIVRNIVLDLSNKGDSKYTGRVFTENGMNVYDVEVLGVTIEQNIAKMLEAHQTEIIQKTLELSDANAQLEVATKLAEVEKTKAELKNANELYIAELEQKRYLDAKAKDEELRAKDRAMEEAATKAENDLQGLLSEIQKAKLAREKKEADLRLAAKKELAALEKEKQDAYAEAVKKIVESIGPDLVAAMNNKSNAELVAAATKSMSPYAIANGESVANTVDKLLRGTTLEGVIGTLAAQKQN